MHAGDDCDTAGRLPRVLEKTGPATLDAARGGRDTRHTLRKRRLNGLAVDIEPFAARDERLRSPGAEPLPPSTSVRRRHVLIAGERLGGPRGIHRRERLVIPLRAAITIDTEQASCQCARDIAGSVM